MSRQSTAAQRNLSLTEELEKLEQSITLTLQEIDHNFSRAHRIVTTSILPVVEQYAEHSKNVWESSQFWKQFFEASANVSLSGYEEQRPEDEYGADEEAASVTSPTSTYISPAAHGHSTPSQTPTANGKNFGGDGQMSPSRSEMTTPRQQKQAPTAAPYSSPYEALKRDVLPSAGKHDSKEDTSPSTPHANQSHDVPGAQSTATTPFAQSAAGGTASAARRPHRTPGGGGNDVLLHRVLDRNWRVQATPHSTARLPHRSKQSSPDRTNTTSRGVNFDNDIDSSPALPAAPELRAEIFDSPARKGTSHKSAAASRASLSRPRIPGVSVLNGTPGGARSSINNKENKNPLASGGPTANGAAKLWEDSDSDGDAEGGYTSRGGEILSPPKTMSFHVPQARMVKTPAREASKKIVEDILHTADRSAALHYSTKRATHTSGGKHSIKAQGYSDKLFSDDIDIDIDPPAGDDEDDLTDERDRKLRDEVTQRGAQLAAEIAAEEEGSPSLIKRAPGLLEEDTF